MKQISLETLSTYNHNRGYVSEIAGTFNNPLGINVTSPIFTLWEISEANGVPYRIACYQKDDIRPSLIISK